MIGQFIEAALSAASPSFVTELFCWFILATFCFAIFEAVRGRHSRFLEHAPNLMTSLGILGTFTGVVIGLLEFQPTDIDASIEGLLAGLQTAFVTSLFGMALAILFKGADSWVFAPKREADQADVEVPEDVDATDIYRVLSEQKGLAEKSVKLSDFIARANKKMLEALSGQEEGSLNGQMRLLRTDVSDLGKTQARLHSEFSEKLWAEFRNFAELLSKSASEQIVAALRDVLQDFNQKVAEHIGDNFKALNESVGRLLEWQENYKQQLQQMMQQYEQGVTAITQTQASVADIGEKAEKIPASMDRLREVLEVNQHQINELKQHLEAFVLMRDKAVDAVPQIESQIEQMLSSMGEGAKGISSSMDSAVETMAKGVERTNIALTSAANEVVQGVESIQQNIGDTVTELSSGGRQLQKDLKESGDQLREVGAAAATQFAQTSEALATALQQALDRNAQAVRQGVEDAIRKTGDMSEQATRTMADNINEQMRVMNEAMGREINRAMQALGDSLGGIAAEIVKRHQAMVQDAERRA